MKGYKVEVEV
jgi:arginyl-tRNA--protein-N-Asp/Glu arginylyltransferase